MPIFSNPFKSKPAPFVPGHKIANERKLQDVLGEAFDYDVGFNASSSFCKKMLLWGAKEYSTENLLFVIVCTKYVQAPSRALFNQIYNEFIPATAPRQVNIKSLEFSALTAIFNVPETDPPTNPSSTVFVSAVNTIKALVKSDSLKRMKLKPFDEVFRYGGEKPATQKNYFDDAIAFLRTYGIVLI